MTFALLFVLALAPQSTSAQASASPSAGATTVPSAMPSQTPRASGSATPSAAPSAGGLVAPAAEDPAITKRAKDWFHRMQTGNVDRSQLDAKMNAALTDDLVKQSMTRLAPLGTPSGFKFVKAAIIGKVIAYYYQLTTPSGSTFYWLFGLDPDGKIAGFYVRAELPE